MKTQYRLPLPQALGVGIPLVAFSIYILTSLLLPWAWAGPYCCELPSFAVAVSNIVYGAPLGTIRPDVRQYLEEHPYDQLGPALSGLIEAIPTPSEAAGPLEMTTLDGNGIGYPLFATAAFRLFGLHSWATLLSMLLLMAIAATAFLGRFGQRMASVVTLYFVTLTALLFTFIVWQPGWRWQIAESSIRYFPLVAVLPVLHILLHLLEPPAAEPGVRRRRYALLGIQAALLALAILVRMSAASFLGAIGVVWLVVIWRRDRRTPLIRDAVLIGGVGAALVAALIYTMPREYRTEGRITTVFWHRLVGSLSYSPEFPFPGLDKMFDDCAKTVDGLRQGYPDANAECLWIDYQVKHGLSRDPVIYTSEYETTLAKQFYKIARAYPHEVFDALFYYKFLLVTDMLKLSLQTNFSDDQTLTSAELHFFPYPASAIALLAIALVVGLAHLMIGGWVSPPTLGRIAGVAFWTMLWTLPPYFVAWANPATIVDLSFYCIFCSALALACVLSLVAWTARRLRGAFAHPG